MNYCHLTRQSTPDGNYWPGRAWQVLPNKTSLVQDSEACQKGCGQWEGEKQRKTRRKTLPRNHPAAPGGGRWPKRRGNKFIQKKENKADPKAEDTVRAKE